MNLQEMHDKHVHPHSDDWRYASASMKWYGWGSPVGLSIFFVAICVCVALMRWAFFVLH